MMEADIGHFGETQGTVPITSHGFQFTQQAGLPANAATI